MDSSLYRDERQAYVKMGEYVNSKWNPSSYHQLATFIKPTENSVSEWKRMQNGGKKNAIDSIFNVNQTKCIIFINSKVAGEYKTC